MNLRILIVSTFLIFTFKSFAQNANVRKYHELVNRAEILICKDSGQYALPLYAEAFSIFDKPFKKDVHNYAKLGLQFNDSTAIKHVFPKIRLLGYNTKEYVKYYQKNNYQGVAYFAEQESKYQEKSSIDSAYMQFIFSLMNADQKVRFRDSDSPDFYDSIRITDSVNIDLLGKYIEKNGFPTEYRISYPADYYLLLHHYRLLDRGIPLDSILLTNVRNGNLHPHYYAMLNDGSYNMFNPNTAMDELVIVKPKGLYFGSNRLYHAETKSNRLIDEDIEKFDWTVHVIPFTAKEAKVMNKARKHIYMETIEETIIKAQYSKGMFQPFSYITIPIIPMEEF